MGPKNVDLPEFILANKVKFHRDETLALLRKSKIVLVAKGKKLLRFDLSQDASDDDLAQVVLGRSGTLRAPAFRIADTFVVGFHQQGYEELF